MYIVWVFVSNDGEVVIVDGFKWKLQFLYFYHVFNLKWNQKPPGPENKLSQVNVIVKVCF